MEEIDNQIRDWAKERYFDSIESDSDSINGNQWEETTELALNASKIFRAKTDEDKMKYACEVIDAFADKYVYATVDMTKTNISESDIKKLSTIKSHQAMFLNMVTSDIVGVLSETLKEINSRTGEWSDELQKWKKHTTPEAKALWYKADYTPYIKMDVLIAVLDDMIGLL